MPTVRLTHPDKVLFGADGITKAQLAEHYARVAEAMLPHVCDRPLSLQVYPGGIGRPGHFLKQIPEYFPAWVGRAELPKRGGTVSHVVARNADTLRMLVQHNAITLHVPTARVDRPDRPDRVIMDFDPEDADDWDIVVAGARMAGELLHSLGLVPFYMTTGSRGLHVVAPLRREVNYPEVLALAKGVGRRLAEAHDGLTLEFKKDKREGRVFVDTLRNRKAHTSVAPWAVRARDGAPVATPVVLEELTPDLRSDGWTVRSIPERLRVGDPWEGLRAAAGSPRSAARRLAAA